jgi:hypothetical protein
MTFLVLCEYIRKVKIIMGHIKKFHDFFSAASSEMNEENDDKDLLRDLERVGMKEQTYTEEMFQDAMDNVNFYEFFEFVDSDGDVDWDVSKGSMEINVAPKFQGFIYGKWYTSDLWEAIVSSITDLNPDDYDGDEERFTLDQLEAAFDAYNWQRNTEEIGTSATQNDDVALAMSGTENTDSYDVDVTVEITAEPSDYVDQDDIISDIIGNL